MSGADRSANHPGLFASADSVLQAQQASVRYANSHVKADVPNGDIERARLVDDAREQRYRVLVRSTFLWVMFGIPLLCFACLVLLMVFRAAIMGESAYP